MNDRKILAAIDSLHKDINSRFDDIERRLSETEEKQSATARKQVAQGKDIETLFQRLDALCEYKPIWKSRDGKETAVQTKDAEAVFRKTGFSQREALRILKESERLSRDPDGVHLKKVVRSKEVGRVRAVVIISEDE